MTGPTGDNPVPDARYGQNLVRIPDVGDLALRAQNIRRWTRRGRAKCFRAIVDELNTRFERAIANHENIWRFAQDRSYSETFSLRCIINCPEKDSGLFNCVVAIGRHDRASRTEVSYTRGRKSQPGEWIDSTYGGAFQQLVTTLFALASQGIYPNGVEPPTPPSA